MVKEFQRQVKQFWHYTGVCQEDRQFRTLIGIVVYALAAVPRS